MRPLLTPRSAPDTPPAAPAISSVTYGTPSACHSSRLAAKISCPRRHESRTTAADGGSRPYPLTPTCVSCMLPPTTADSTYGTSMGCTGASQTRPQYGHAHAPDHGCGGIPSPANRSTLFDSDHVRPLTGARERYVKQTAVLLAELANGYFVTTG